MELKVKSLKELYEKDFYLWVQQNLRLLKNKEYELVDWENLLERDGLTNLYKRIVAVKVY